MKRKQMKDPVHITVRVEEELHSQLIKVAEEREVSVGAVMRMAMKKLLKDLEGKDATQSC